MQEVGAFVFCCENQGKIPMDRQIKIAILIACVLSLGLGLIWDNVIEASRKTLKTKESKDSTAPDSLVVRFDAPKEGELIHAKNEARNKQKKGNQDSSQEIKEYTREPVQNQAEKFSQEQSSEFPWLEGVRMHLDPQKDQRILEQLKPFLKGDYYTVQKGDSWDKIAYTRFRFYGTALEKSGKWKKDSAGQRQWRDFWKKANPEARAELWAGDSLFIPR